MNIKLQTNAKKISFITFGCKVNKYETQLIREKFPPHLYKEVSHRKELADIYIINSCTVTNRSNQKVKKTIRSIKRQNNEATIVITGCYAQELENNLEELKDIDFLINNEKKYQIKDILCGFNPATDYSNRSINSTVTDFANQTRAFVKIQDGCESFCSYCIIPYVRGKVKSKAPYMIIKEAEELISKGFKEIVLVGIHIGQYGKETNYKWNLNSLLLQLVKIKGNFRIRLSSLEANEINYDILDTIKNHNIVPHLHVPLQSGDDEILKKMNRNYTSKKFLSIYELVEKKLDRPSITTDIIVGFPGETEANFLNTVLMCEKIPFSKAHIFPYSDRNNTAASKMKKKIPNQIKKELNKKLSNIDKNNTKKYLKQIL